MRFLLLALSVAILPFCAGPVAAQVIVQMQGDEVIISNAGYQAQRLVRAAGKAQGEAWSVSDNVGNFYASGNRGSRTRGGDEPSEGDVIVVGGYQGGDEPSEGDVIVVGGYQDVLDRLVEHYGAVIEHDEQLRVHLIRFPEADDPLATFFQVIVTDTLEGRPLVDYFRLVEVISSGVFGPDAEILAKADGTTFPFPNDAFYRNQWNLWQARIDKAQWHPARPRKAVRISIIDSGIAADEYAHPGLDGTAVEHQAVAPGLTYPLSHALNIVTMLADRSQDGSGVTGLLGDQWDDQGCYEQAPLLADRPPQIYSFNVGDFGPVSLYVAQAILASIDRDVDVINLSLSLAYSPVVAQAIEEAQAHGVIVVAAAGNYAPEEGEKPAHFPANMDGVISVGAAGAQMRFSDFSANDGVDILAPGEDLVVGDFEGHWRYVSGTSYAAPHVTAAIAMMRAVRPELTAAEALEALQARGRAAAYNNGVGFLNVLSSLNDVLPPEERERWIASPHGCAAPGDEAAGKVTEWAGWADDYDDHIDDDLFPPQAGAGAELPEQAALLDSYPNPFNPATTIRFALPEAQRVRLAIHNVLGQQVAVLVDGMLPAGRHDARFEAAHLSSGVYLARLETPTERFVHRMILAK